MNNDDFEKLLGRVAKKLTQEARETPFSDSKEFENRVRSVLVEYGKELTKDLDPPAQAFPDIVLNKIGYGVEVKFTTNDTWRSVAILSSKRRVKKLQI